MGSVGCVSCLAQLCFCAAPWPPYGEACASALPGGAHCRAAMIDCVVHCRACDERCAKKFHSKFRIRAHLLPQSVVGMTMRRLLLLLATPCILGAIITRTGQEAPVSHQSSSGSHEGWTRTDTSAETACAWFNWVSGHNPDCSDAHRECCCYCASCLLTNLRIIRLLFPVIRG
jgi:hypothetical protein